MVQGRGMQSDARAGWVARMAIACVSITAIVAIGVMMGLFSGSRPEGIGSRDGRLAPCKRTPNCVSSQADVDKDAGHYVAPIRIEGRARDVWMALRSVLRSMPRVRLVTEGENYLHAECASRIMGFVDDAEFLLDEKARVIHVRSASRLGKSDFGVNRARAESIRSRLAAMTR